VYDSNKLIYDIIGIVTYVRFKRLFELSDNKTVTTTKMYALALEVEKEVVGLGGRACEGML